MRPSVLITQELLVGYDSRSILPPINLDIRQGEMVGLIGSNGAGKSTLLRTLAAAQKPLSGSIMVDGEDISHLSARALARKIAIVYTDRITSSGLTARQVIALGRNPHISALGRLHKHDNIAVDDAIAKIGIENLADKYMSQMSDGERQKVMLARTLAQDTPVIILDEPTTFLDVASRLEIFHLLRSLADDMNKSIIISTHEIAPLLRVAHRLLMITYDRALISDTPERIIASGEINRLFSPVSPVRFSAAHGDFSV